MKTIRTVIRAFIVGTIAGLLVAPRPGRETREMLRDRWNDLLDGATGMSFDMPAAPGGDTTTISTPGYTAGAPTPDVDPETL